MNPLDYCRLATHGPSLHPNPVQLPATFQGQLNWGCHIYNNKIRLRAVRPASRLDQIEP